MNNLLALLIVWMGLAGTAAAQKQTARQVPASVKQSYHSMFPGVRRVEWKLKGDKNYEAEFKYHGADIAAKFDATGKWLETETTIARSKLPQTVSETISKDFKEYRIIETQKIERFDDKQILFEVHLANAKEILKAQFDSQGAVLSKSTKPKKGS